MIIRNEQSYIGLNSKEINGYYLCRPLSLEKRIFLNEQAFDIFQHCNGLTLDEILEWQIEKYPEIPVEKLDEDIKNIIWFFYNVGMLEIEGDDMMVSEPLEELFCMAGERDFGRIYRYICEMYQEKNENDICYLSPKYNLNTMDDLLETLDVPKLRLSHVNGNEIYYKFKKSKSQKIDGIINFSFIGNGTVVYINMLICKLSDLGELLKKFRKEMASNGYVYLKIIFEDNNNTIHWLEKNGFTREAVLKGESLNNEDILVFTSSIQENME